MISNILKAWRNVFFQLILIAFSAFTAFAQQSFEGEVDLKYTGRQGDNTIRYFTRDGNVRIELGEKARMAGRSMTAGPIILKQNQLLVLLPEKKMYIERTIDLKGKANEFGRKNDISKNLKKTGDTRDILGYKAEQWILKDNNTDIEIWSTGELGNIALFQGLGGITQADMPDWQKELLSSGFFPMLLIQKDRDGREINRLEVTAVNKKELSAGLFEVPSGYRSMASRDQQDKSQENTGHK